MEIPVNEIEALLEYVKADLANGVQMNTIEWENTVKNVEAWLHSSGLTQRAPDLGQAVDREDNNSVAPSG